MQAPFAPAPGLRDDALRAFDAALAELPAGDARAAFLRAGGRLRIFADDDAANLPTTLALALRLRVLAYAAAARRTSYSLWRGAPPTPVRAELAAAALAELPPGPRAPHELALGLWSGGAVAAPTASERGPEAQRLAVELAIGWGAGGDPATATALAEAQLGGGSIALDAARVAVVRAYLDAGAAALPTLLAIASPAARLEAIFELTLASALAGEGTNLARLRSTAEQTYVLAAEHELWPHAADIQIAGILAATGGPPALAASALGTATRKLEGVLALDARVRIYRLALLAAPHVGIDPWRALLEQFLADRQLLRSPPERTHLLFETAASAGYFVDPETRSEALARVAELLGRMPDLALRGLVCAELGRLLAQLPNRSPATWVAECKKTLMTRPADAPFLGRTLRLLAETDAGATLAIACKLPRPEERALGALIVAESACGIRER